MPSYTDLHQEFQKLSPEQRGVYVANKSYQSIQEIAKIRNQNVLYYASAFLQKPTTGGLFASINPEDINGFMSGLYGYDRGKDLLLILHTPGGLAGAAEAIVEYLRSKFEKIDVAIPVYAMSAGTMIALGCDSIIMDGQSQLGPIDPQMPVGDGYSSAHSIIEQFKDARADILANVNSVHVWAPILRSIGPALLKEAQRVHSSGKNIVKQWLEKYMFSGDKELASEAAKYFSSVKHGVHEKRIGREEAKEKGLNIIHMEENPAFRDAVLTLYHLSTLTFENTSAIKIVQSSTGCVWIKNSQGA